MRTAVVLAALLTLGLPAVALGGTCTAGYKVADGCGTIGSLGCCAADVNLWCEKDTVCGLWCQATPQCGWSTSYKMYSCGTDGAADPGGAAKACACIPCSGTPGAGCCDGSLLRKCVNGCLAVVECQDLPAASQCGWSAADTAYRCQATAEAGPSPFPRDCPAACTPNCGGKVCGDDGCGGSCGTCATGRQCVSGQCQAICTPSCSGKVCGPDGCGGSCGTCAAGDTCVSGDCECISECGDRECGDVCGVSCGTCPTAFQHTCTAAGMCQCNPYCTGRTCGADGCGGSCGTCPQGLVCGGGQCIDSCQPYCGPYNKCGSDGCDGTCGTCLPGQSCDVWGRCQGDPCTAQCNGKQCGPDGCGGTCGTCPSGQQCIDAKCQVACVASCDGKECGDDGCGGSCGTCPEGKTCQANQCQVGPCIAACAGRTCGDDGCGGSCGACLPPATCGPLGTCVAPCVPACDDAQCGDDGCGGSCGTCGPGLSCGPDRRCFAGPPQDLPIQEDRGAGDDPGADDQAADATTPTTCQAGYAWSYGQCVPVKGDDGSKGGGCGSGGSPLGAGVALLVAGVAVLLEIRRRKRK